MKFTLLLVALSSILFGCGDNSRRNAHCDGISFTIDAGRSILEITHSAESNEPIGFPVSAFATQQHNNARFDLEGRELGPEYEKNATWTFSDVVVLRRGTSYSLHIRHIDRAKVIIQVPDDYHHDVKRWYAKERVRLWQGRCEIP